MSSKGSWLIAAILAVTLMACTRGDSSLHPATPPATAPDFVAPTATATPYQIALPAHQARQVATITAFFDAFNAGRHDEALAFFAATPMAQFSDCDFRENRQIAGRGQEAIGQWLTARIADHDQFVVKQIEASSQSRIAIGVAYERRANDTLRALGQPDGIRPGLATKVVFTDDGRQIDAFAHGCG